MTAERLNDVEFDADPEELALILAAPAPIDPNRISDPIAIYGTEGKSEFAAPRPLLIDPLRFPVAA